MNENKRFEDVLELKFCTIGIKLRTQLESTWVINWNPIRPYGKRTDVANVLDRLRIPFQQTFCSNTTQFTFMLRH